ncbi:MAG: sulfite exporter TauE/SafE family protein, partial [Propionibacteriaceae bacterium]|nr:sulfite exporter TauE/SafE family protein [Propionibacteriaceae bacterium]
MPKQTARPDSGRHTTKVFVQGMTCSACEQRVGKAIRRISGVQRVNVSARKGQAVITSAAPIPAAEITQAVKKAGYRIGRGRAEWLAKEPQVWTDALIAAGGIAVIVLLANQFGWLALTDSITRVAGSGNLAFIALLGVAASLSTCMALVGGIVISLSASFAAKYPAATTAQRLRPQLMFNLGRIVGFGALGALLGVVGSTFTMSGPLLAVAMIAVSVVMGLLGIRLSGISPRLAGAGITLPGALTSWMHKDAEYRDWTGLALGAASFFLPCGFTQAVQVYALSTGDALSAGLVMAVFALGTAPGLIGAGGLSTLIKTDRIFRYIGVVVIAFAVFNVMGAVTTLVPAGSQTPTATQRTGNVADSDGYQVAKVAIGGSDGYNPKDTVVYAGEPVKWEFQMDSFSCAAAVNASKLGIPDLLFLEPGTTTVDIDLPEP